MSRRRSPPDGGSAPISRTCQGNNVTVEGTGSQIVLSGNCNTLTVNGQGNQVDVEAVQAIVVNSDGNEIVYGGSPTIEDNGLGNIITPR